MSPATEPPDPPARLAVLGAGAWGSVLASLLADAGHDVRVWVRDEARAARWSREDAANLRGRATGDHRKTRRPRTIRPTASLHDAVGGAAGVFFVLPNAALDDVARRLASTTHQIPVVVSCSKGLLPPGLQRPGERLAHVLPESRIAVLSGPNLAREIAAGLPAAATVASRDPDCATAVQGWLASSRFRLYTDDDPIGVEVAGAYKNVIALAAGMADGLRLGENAKAALITRGLHETVRLGLRLGGRTRTFYGLAGVGDLIATCASSDSRNHRAGERLAAGERGTDLLSSGPTIEGLPTVRAVMSYAAEHGVRLPIARQVHAVAFEGRSAAAALDTLLQGDPRAEHDPGAG